MISDSRSCRETRAESPSRPRVAFYSHDSFGLGHLRRSLLLAESLGEHGVEVEALVVTGSPRAHFFPRSRWIDVVKLPAVTKDANGHYVSRNSSRPLADTLRERKGQMRRALFEFRPDLLVVDHVPAGLEGELLPLLADLRRECGTLLVAGLRDILDSPETVRADWSRFGIDRILERVYDRVWVYGCEEVFPLGELYDLAPSARERLEYLGYLGRDATSVPAFETANPTAGRPKILCIVGGGGDGFPVASAFVQAVSGRPDLEATVVTGPFIAQHERRRLGEIVERSPGAHVIHFTACLDQRIAEADLVVTMGGYNSLMECLSFARRTLVVPRIFPRQEQWIRSQAFAARGLVEVADPRELEPTELLNQMLEILELPPPPPAASTGLRLDGARRFTRAVARELGIDPSSAGSRRGSNAPLVHRPSS